ncbi:MAG: spermidine synthase [Flavobacteriales bacterium]
MLRALRKLVSYLVPVSVEKRKSTISPGLEVTLLKGKYVLDSKNVNYSFGGLHEVFSDSFKHYNIRNRKINTVLILGFGAGSVASILQHEYKKECAITGVEKDPEVLELAKKYFGLEKYNNLILYCEDALEYVKRCSDTFDLIVIDVFIDNLVPGSFHAHDFLTGVKRLLNKNGIVFFNKISNSPELKIEVAALAAEMNKSMGRVEKLTLKLHGMENTVLVHQNVSN